MFDIVLSQPLPLAEAAAAVIFAHGACKGVSKIGSLIAGGEFRLKEYRDSLMRTQAEKDAKAIEAGDARFDGKVLHPALALPEMPLNATLEYLPMLEGQRQESNNLNANLAVALTILNETPEDEVSDEPVSPDWFARWRREAQVIGEQELQSIWGRILAEEVKNPESISLITLDVLKCVTAADAALFCNIAKFSVNNIIPTNFLQNKANLKFIEIQKLQWANLLGHSKSVSPVPSLSIDGRCNILAGNGFAFTLYPPQEKNIAVQVEGFSLTLAGREILHIADTIPPVTLELTKMIGDCIWEHTPGEFQEMNAHFTDKDHLFSPDKIVHSWNRTP